MGPSRIDPESGIIQSIKTNPDEFANKNTNLENISEIEEFSALIPVSV